MSLPLPLVEIVLIAVTAWLVIQFIGRPLAEVNPNADLSEAPSQLQERKQALLVSLKDAEFDYQMGKLSEAEYQKLRGALEASVVQVMRAMDEVEPEAAPSSAGPKTPATPEPAAASSSKAENS